MRNVAGEFVETWAPRSNAPVEHIGVVYQHNTFGHLALVEQELLTHLLYRAGYQMTATSQEDQ